ncbi:DUF4373 domain-containing protein [Parabacteroides sp. AM08-6]|uniref:DUF4373 domain-containing protein n=1 Tax=Parabacteroides sp. AM08-6 TaxID=2292053 RepID=UPI000F00A351|nr:DUF4373 domain-containing protein [Parabacteroides sp. AM08-6]RHJ76391.1 DUF4373 domain-containing protein [Parabacteroides sp. AM08-6]
MAKTGFPYYRAETDRFQDIRIKRLKKEFKGTGYAVYSYILNEIYRVKGCFLEWDENTAFDVSEYWDLKESQVEEIVKYCCAIGLFDKGLFTNGRVITSRAIQIRYLEMSKLAKRTNFNIPDNICLIPEEIPKLPEEIRKPTEFSDKVEYSIEKNSKEKKYPPLSPTGENGGCKNILNLKDSNNDRIERNFEGLTLRLKKMNIPPDDFNTICQLSNNGEIGHPVWSIIPNAERGGSRLHSPGKYIISELKKTLKK